MDCDRVSWYVLDMVKVWCTVFEWGSWVVQGVILYDEVWGRF